jgi:hypothetical protein
MTTERGLLGWFITLVAVCAAGSFPAVAGTEMGQYPAGAFGQMKVGILPPPGFVLENGTLAYTAKEFVNGDGSKQDLETTVLVNRTLGMWVTDKKVLGADFAMAAAIPFGNFAAPRPQPGEREALGLGDIYLQPLTLGWHRAPFHVTASYGAFAPTGRYEFGRNDNTGRGFWSHLLTLGGTYLQDAPRPWHFTLQGRYEIPMEIQGTDIRPGQAFLIEYGVGKQISDRIDLGLVGYGAWQTTDIKGSDFKGDPRNYRYMGLGPEIQFKAIQRKDWLLMVTLRSYFDFDVRNAPRGNLTILSIAAAF